MRQCKTATWIIACYGAVVAVVPVRDAAAQVPNHPVITEVFNNPSGNDGPTGRLPTNLDQEFCEIYLPPAGALDPALDKDYLRLTFYEIEGDSSNTERGYVSQRFDLPSIDVDPANGTTPGTVARPVSGIVVLGWVDYNNIDPPTALAGTSSTRRALINGGVTATPGILFVAMNGNQYGGTTNFATPQAESFIDVPNENAAGVFRNGSDVYLLVNRDDPGYALLADRDHPLLGPSNAMLPSGSVLGLSSLLDGIAGNDDTNFTTSDQPYASPTGLNIDLEDVLPAGGVFSDWVAQIPENSGGGYARRFVDELKTTEDATAGNEDPALDAQECYRQVFRTGPFYPTPGRVVFRSSSPELAVPEGSRLQFDVIAGTTGRPGLLCANVGGDFPIDVTAAPGTSSNPNVATFTSGMAAVGVKGQTEAYPQIAAIVPLRAPIGAIVTAPVTFEAVNSRAGDPPIGHPSGVSSIQATVLRPSTGTDQLGLPYQATVFAAIQGHGVDPMTTNEWLASDVGQYVLAGLGHNVLVAEGHGDLLIDPMTDLESLAIVGPLRRFFPTSEDQFIDVLGPPGTRDLVLTVLTSPKYVSSPSSYAGSVNTLRTGVRAYEIDLPETSTSGGGFSPSEQIFFYNALGGEYDKRDGLGWTNTERTFELALVETNVTSTGIEDGNHDDFGLVVEVGRTKPGATVVSGELVFLSYTGGLGGEDLDGVDIPGQHATNTIFLDLDNLDQMLGCASITRLFVIDAAASGTVNVIEALSLNPTCAVDDSCPFFADGDRNGKIDQRDLRLLDECLLGPGVIPAPSCDMFDADADKDVDLHGFAILQQEFDGA